MLQRLTIYTERGKHDSVREPVKIVFTLTPAESKRSTWPFYPLEFDTLIHDNSDLEIRKELTWSTQLEVRLCRFERREGKSYCLRDGKFQGILPGQARTMTRVPGQGTTEVQWGPAEPYIDRIAHLQSSIVAINKTGSPQNVSLHCKTEGTLPWWTMAAYYQVKDGECIIAPSELVLQAYVVDISKDYDCVVLLPDDLTRPLFSMPLSCDALPATSTWKLCQDKNGAFQLKNDNEPESAFYPPKANAARLEKMITGHGERIEAVEGKTARLATLLGDLEARLAVAEASVSRVEKSIATREQPAADVAQKLRILEKHDDDTREDMSMVQKTLVNIRLQLDGINAKAPAGGEKTADLANLHDRIQTELSMVKKTIATTDNQMTGLDRRIAAVEANAEKLMAMLDGGPEDSEEILFAQGNSSTQARNHESTAAVFPAKFAQ